MATSFYGATTAVPGDTLLGDGSWVRELEENERPYAHHARTGDVLRDGSVLLRQEDMNRMGLEALRQWVLRNVRVGRSIVIVGCTGAQHGATVHDLT